jgi:hypothetical protein
LRSQSFSDTTQFEAQIDPKPAVPRTKETS